MHKSCPVQIKAAGVDDGLGEGQFRAVVSVFGNVDSYGDMVMPGAFTDTLNDWQKSGDPIPVYWSHRMDDPDYNIGYVLEARETEQGLEVLAQLDQGADASSKAQQVYRLLKGRRVSQFSFAYDVEEQSQVEKDGQSYNELRKLRLYEVGPTPIGANQETELLAVKAATDPVEAALTLARDISTASGTSLLDALKTLVKAAEQPTTPTFGGFTYVQPSTSTTSTTFTLRATSPAQASDDGPVKDEEPHGAKSEEPSRRSSVSELDIRLRLMALERNH